VTILAPIPAPVNSDASTWPAWTDLDRWELGPDGDPIAPYTAEDAEWWVDQTRDDDTAADADLDDPGGEREAEDRLCRGLLL
jgi:hypothetical protein